MRLRPLRPEDAPLMLEWMHDENVTYHLSGNFAAKQASDCIAFIAACADTAENWHLAIADEQDVYMGTVSLKHIDPEEKEAEFAISTRSCAMGKGISRAAMAEMLRLGFAERGLQRIYWCVAPENTRAVRFYDKNGYQRVAVQTLPAARRWYTPEQQGHYLWYCAEA